MFQYSFTERTVPVPVSVPGKRFLRFRFRVRFLGKRFRRCRFPVPVRFLGHLVHRKQQLICAYPLHDGNCDLKKFEINDISITWGSSEQGRCRRGRSEIPHFPGKLQSFALVLREQEKNEEERRTKKNEAKQNSEEKQKKISKNGKSLRPLRSRRSARGVKTGPGPKSQNGVSGRVSERVCGGPGGPPKKSQNESSGDCSSQKSPVF